MRRDYLFGGNDAWACFEEYRNRLASEVEAADTKYLSTVPESDYIRYLVQKYTLQAPILHVDKQFMQDVQDTSIDVRGRFDYMVGDEDEPVHVTGTKLTICIPFEGDGNFFNLKLSSTHFSRPQGEIVGDEIHLSFTKLPQDFGSIKQEAENEIKRIQECVRQLESTIQEHNKQLEQIAKDAIAKRKKKIDADSSLIKSLGIPLKKTNADSVVNVPLARNPIHIQKPPAAQVSQSPDPMLPDSDYGEILKIINNLSLVIERNPQTFTKLDEPDIRNIILVMLNAFFEGIATGETFNGAGKTDILLRYQNQNLFVAECKFWQGQQQLTEALEQLLGYVTWRDTKTALIIFNRNKDLSSVLKKIEGTIESHDCFKAKLTGTEETIRRYRFSRKDDKNREFLLTVMVFEVPVDK